MYVTNQVDKSVREAILAGNMLEQMTTHLAAFSTSLAQKVIAAGRQNEMLPHNWTIKTIGQEWFLMLNSTQLMSGALERDEDGELWVGASYLTWEAWQDDDLRQVIAQLAWDVADDCWLSDVAECLSENDRTKARCS